jgi:hypothetical protein
MMILALGVYVGYFEVNAEPHLETVLRFEWWSNAYCKIFGYAKVVLSRQKPMAAKCRARQHLDCSHVSIIDCSLRKQN